MIFYYGGFFHLFRQATILNGKRLTILAFHRVSKESTFYKAQGLPTITISVENLELLIKFLMKHYQFISLKNFVGYVKDGTPLKDHYVIFTFDDGYKELIENTLPLLKKYGLTGVLFVPTHCIDNDNYFWWDALYVALTSMSDDHKFSMVQKSDQRIKKYLKILCSKNGSTDKQIFHFIDQLQTLAPHFREHILQYVFSFKKNSVDLPAIMSWAEVKRIARAGWEIGSHTVSHQFLTTVTEDIANQEITRSKQVLEEYLNRKVYCFSYPGGKYNKKIIRMVRDAGYDCACTSDKGLNSMRDNLFTMKRINISDDNVTNSRGQFSPALTAWHLTF